MLSYCQPWIAKAVDVGLKFVHNDACYPAIITIGQLVEALQSGQYDLNNTSVMMTQTGGVVEQPIIFRFYAKLLRTLVFHKFLSSLFLWEIKELKKHRMET